MSIDINNSLRILDLRKKLIQWRSLALILGIISAILLTLNASDTDITAVSGNYIARIEIKDIIVESRDRDTIITELATNDAVKAVIVHINSPGGTIVGGETLYNSIRTVAEQKPVVAVLGSVAASGGYMAAIATDYIIAHQGTVTGSIGVMLQTAEITDLANKLGVKLMSFKSSPLKGVPSPLEKLSPEAAIVVQESVNDAYNLFIDMVASQRKMLTREQIITLADGRVYTGRQAFDAKLIDALGSEIHARSWLKEEHNITENTPIKDISLKKNTDDLRALLNSAINSILPGYTTSFSQSGAILALWAPGI